MKAQSAPGSEAIPDCDGSAASALDRPFTITIFDNAAAGRKREAHHSLRSLANLVQDTSAAAKAKLPWLKLARFGEARTKKGSLRHDANLLIISGVEVDYDGEQTPFAEAVERVTNAGLLALIYTSPSHTEAAPRWRVLCPTSTELPPTARAQLLGRLNGLFDGTLSGESWTLSQAYYYGRVADNPAHQVEIVDGTSIDQLNDLDTTWRGKSHTSPGQAEDGNQRSGPVDEAALLAEITSGTSYHPPMTRLAGKWAREDMPYKEAERRLFEAMSAVFPPDRDA